MADYLPHTDDEIAAMLAFLGLSTPSTSSSAPCPPSLRVAGGLALAPGAARARRARPPGRPGRRQPGPARPAGLLRRGRGLRPRGARRWSGPWPGARSSSPPTPRTSPRWPRASSRRSSSSRPWWPGWPGCRWPTPPSTTGPARWSRRSTSASARQRAPGGAGSRPASTRTGGRCWPPSPPAPATELVDDRRSQRRAHARGRAAPAPSGPPGVVVVGYPNYLGLPRGPGRRPAPWPTPHGALLVVAADPVVGRHPALARRLGGRRGGGGGPGLRHRPRLRRPLPRALRLHARAGPPPARPPGRRDGRRRGPTGLRHDAAGPRAGHPPGEGHLQRLHQPDPDGGDRRHPARLAGHRRAWPRWRCAAPGGPATCREALLALDGVEPLTGATPVVREFAVRTPVPARPWWSSGWPTRASWPAWPSADLVGDGGDGSVDGRRRAPTACWWRSPSAAPGREIDAYVGAPSTRRCAAMTGRGHVAAGGRAASAPAARPRRRADHLRAVAPGPARAASCARPACPSGRRRGAGPGRAPPARAGRPGRGLRARPGRPLHPAQPPPVLGRPRRLPARLVHHEVQPQGLRRRGRPARAGRGAPGGPGLA